jgi:hypothetical protein
MYRYHLPVPPSHPSYHMLFDRNICEILAEAPSVKDAHRYAVKFYIEYSKIPFSRYKISMGLSQ